MDRFNITLVDGFAGGGMYQDDKPGSPFVMIEAVEKARVDINKGRDNKVAINPEYFFIEKDPDNFAALEKCFLRNQHKPKLLQGDFNKHSLKIVEAITKRNPREGGGAIFFLDQEGYSKVDMRTIQCIRNELPQSEIILTFAISHLIDFIKDPDKLQNQINKINLRHLDVSEFIHLRDSVTDHRNLLESILSTAIYRTSGFPYYKTFYIEPKGNHRGYLLLHLSPHPRAYAAMAETTWEESNDVRHYGKAGVGIHGLCYTGGHEPGLFGKQFTEEAKCEHIEGMKLDLLPIILRSRLRTEDNAIKAIIERTCNDTAATLEMYIRALSELSEAGEIRILGKGGKPKRGGKIQLDDRAIIERQTLLFTSEGKDKNKP